MKRIPLDSRDRGLARGNPLDGDVGPDLIREIGLVPERLANARPLYQTVAQALEEAIASGALAPGKQLPPERRLATWLRISRTTDRRGASRVTLVAKG